MSTYDYTVTLRNGQHLSGQWVSNDDIGTTVRAISETHRVPYVAVHVTNVRPDPARPAVLLYTALLALIVLAIWISRYKGASV